MNVLVKMKFKYKWGKETDKEKRDILLYEFMFLGDALELINAKGEDVDIWVYADCPDDKFKTLKNYIGEKIKGRVAFHLDVDEKYVENSLKVTEVKE